jgi:hypothetical protein
VDTDVQLAQTGRSLGPKRFEARWLQESGFNEKVQESWISVSASMAGEGVLPKLGCLHGLLHEWDSNVLKQPKKRMKKAEKKLEKAMSGPMSEENEVVAKEMAALIDLLL